MWDKTESHKIVHYYWGESKTQFIRESDTYAHWVILAAEEGTFHYAIGDEQGEVGFGKVVLCPPGQTLHRRVNSSMFSFHFIEFKWSEQELPPSAKTKTMPSGAVTITDEQRLLSNFQYLKQASTDKDLTAHYVIDLLLLCLNSVRSVEEVQKPIDSTIRKVAAYIEENASKPMKMEDIAREHGLSPSQFTRRFQDAYQKGPQQYLISVRIHNIKEMLIHTDYTIDTIAQLNGFQNGFYMSKVFTQQTNMNPSEFRKTHRV